MLTLWVGVAEMAHAIDNWRKVTLLARTVADLTSQGDTADPIASATMNDIWRPRARCCAPSPHQRQDRGERARRDTLASLVSPWVCSSVSSGNGASARRPASRRDLIIPAGFNTNGNRYVLAEVTMPYAPMLGSSLVKLVSGMGSTIPLSVSFAWPVRNGIVHKSITSTPSGSMPGEPPAHEILPRRLAASTAGNVAVIFALSSLPLLAFVGPRATASRPACR